MVHYYSTNKAAFYSFHMCTYFTILSIFSFTHVVRVISAFSFFFYRCPVSGLAQDMLIVYNCYCIKSIVTDNTSGLQLYHVHGCSMQHVLKFLRLPTVNAKCTGVACKLGAHGQSHYLVHMAKAAISLLSAPSCTFSLQEQVFPIEKLLSLKFGVIAYFCPSLPHDTVLQ